MLKSKKDKNVKLVLNVSIESTRYDVSDDEVMIHFKVKFTGKNDELLSSHDFDVYV